MTATIIAFPTMLERDEAEFRRRGASNYTRACEEAPHLWLEVLVGRPSAELRARLGAFGRRVAHLASYRDDLPMVALPNGPVIELVAVPGLLGVASADALPRAAG